MRRTVHLLLLLVALATAAPVAEDADQKNILQMLLTADPHENDIIDNNIIEKTRINEYEQGSREDVGEEFSPTTEYVLDSEIKSFTEPIQELELEPEPEPEIVEEDKDVTVSETESVSEFDSGSADEVVEPVPEAQSNNTTKIDIIVETEQQVEPNFDTEIIEIIQLGEEYPPENPEYPSMILHSPKYTINFPKVITELESTDLDQSSIEDEFESNIEDEQYSNQEWPQRYVPGYPNYYNLNSMKPESGNLHNNQEWPQEYAPGYPDSQQYGQDIPYNQANPPMSSNIFGNQEFPLEYIPEIQDSGMVGPMGPAYQVWDEQGPGQLVDNGPIVDTFQDVYPNPGSFINYPGLNQFSEDDMAHAAMEDITIEPIFFDQVPRIYDNTPESSMNDELPEEVFEILDARFDSNANPEDNLELIVIEEEIIDMPQTPIAGEAEHPQDSPIIATAILQDTRPDIDMLGLFGGLEDTIIPEIIEENSYPLEEDDFMEEYLPASEDLPYQNSEQDVIIIENDSFANPNTPEFGEEDFVLDPLAMLPPLIVDIEQAAFPDMPLVNNPSVIPIGNSQFSPINENEQRIYFNDEIREFPSESDFMGPHSHDEFPFGHNQFRPHSHNEDMHYHNDMPHSHNEDMHYHNDMPHIQHDHDHEYNFDNFPQNNYFEDVQGTMKRDGAHIVPDMDMDVDVIELPIIDTGDMGMFNSPLMGSRNPGSTPQITVIIASKPQLKEIWSQFIRPMQQKQFSPVDMTQTQGNVPQFDNMGQYSQNLNNNQFNQNFPRQNFNQQPLQNYNMHQNMNFPQKQLFNSGMGPSMNFNQQPNMGSMFPNFNMDMPNFNMDMPNFNMDMPNLNMDMPSFEDLPAFVDEEIERAEQMFASQQHNSPYGPPMSQFSNNQQNWPTRYAPNYPEFNYINNGQFYPQRNMNNINNQFYIP